CIEVNCHFAGWNKLDAQMCVSFISVGTQCRDYPGPGHIYRPCLRLDARMCSQSSKSSSRHSGFARKRLLQSVLLFCVDAAFWLIQTATSTSLAPVAMKSRNTSAFSPQAAKNLRSIGQL